MSEDAAPQRPLCPHCGALLDVEKAIREDEAAVSRAVREHT